MLGSDDFMNFGFWLTPPVSLSYTFIMLVRVLLCLTFAKSCPAFDDWAVAFPMTLGYLK